MQLPKHTIKVSRTGRRWVKPDKLKNENIRYAVDKDGNYWRARRPELRYHNGDPRFTFASVTKAHVEHMAASGIFK